MGEQSAQEIARLRASQRAARRLGGRSARVGKEGRWAK
jgi:hypothetical protein